MSTEKADVVTGVDRLVELVNAREKIPLVDAAKELGISLSVIQGWIDYFGEEGPVGIEYNFTTPYIVRRKLTHKDILNRAHDLSIKKEIIIRNAEGNLHFFRKHLHELKSIKPELGELRNELGLELDIVKKELAELGNYNKLRDEIQERVKEQRNNYAARIKTIADTILLEKKKHKDSIAKITKKIIIVGREKTKLNNSFNYVKKLNNKLTDIKNTIHALEKRISYQNSAIQNSKLEIENIHKSTKELKQSYDHYNSFKVHSLEEIKGQEKKLLKIQSDIFKKVHKNYRPLPNSRNIETKFKKFFEKNLLAVELYNQIVEDCEEIENNLLYLIKKAKLFKLSVKSNYAEQVFELEKGLSELNNKREGFELKIKKLFSFLKKRS